MAVVEIQTIEGGRLEWVGIMTASETEDAVRWGDAMMLARYPWGMKPKLRLLDRPHGTVIGAWQAEGYEEGDTL